MNYITVTEVAKKMNVSRQTVFDWIYKKGLPYYRWGKRGIRISDPDLDDWLKRYRNHSGEKPKISKLVNL